MENIKEALKIIADIKQFATKRGRDLFEIDPPFEPYDTPNFDFTDNSVGLSFQEDTRHDCPELKWIELSEAELTMSEHEWTAHIESIRKKVDYEKETKAQKKKDRELESKMAEFEKLKRELGI